MRQASSLEKRLNKNATTILIGGIFLSFSALLYLSLCTMPCEDPTYMALHDELKDAQSNAFWKGKMLAPPREISADLVVVVFSAPKNARQRDLVRETWGSNLPSKVVIKFMIGKKSLSEDETKEIEREQLLHSDIVLLKDLEDSFQKLTDKLLEIMRWLNRHIDFKYMMKADEDSFVQLDKLLAELETKPKEKLYWGFFDGRASAKKKGKWSEKDWFLCDRYLPYALGGGYVVSSDLVHYVASNHKLLKLYNNEDVSLGTWLAPLDIKRIHDPRFDTEYKSRGCKNAYLVTHKHTNIELRQFHSNLKTTGKLCDKEVQHRKSYIYNWNVLPSQCCVRNDTSIP